MPTHLSEADVFSVAAGYGLRADETKKLVAAQLCRHKRPPTITEIAVTGALWSEHCSYKSSKLHIKKLHFAEPWVITATGENAGAIDIGDGDAVIFKMESHNHPSYLEPFNGAATGVGGILRDIFTMGAKPIANVNALRFGDIDDKKFGQKMKNLVLGVTRGISHYGNCVGVPMVTGETEFLPCYNGNILVNAMTVGLVRKNAMASAVARGVGNWVVYLGSKTGRDGVKGAVMASQEFAGDDDTSGKPAVQVGDPFAEKLLMDLCLQLIADKKFIAIQDMGAAGLSSSSAEMADKGGVGITLELDEVPMREADMKPEDIMLSESQERMLAVIDPDNFDAIKNIFSQHHLDCKKIGEVVAGNNLVLRMNDEEVANLETNLLVGEAPLYDRPQSKLPAPLLLSPSEDNESNAAPEKNLATYLEKYFASPFGADKSFIYQQYDRLVQGNTILTSGEASAGVIKIPSIDDDKPQQKALAISSHGDPLLCQADPAVGGRAIILETYRKLCAVGARPLAYTNNLNFGNPEDPAIMAAFATILQAMGDVSRLLHFPTISGNVSLYNQTAGKDIYHTPVIGGVGVIADYKNAMGYILPHAPQNLWLIGDGAQTNLGGSRYLFLTRGENKFAPPAELFDATSEKTHGDFVQQIITANMVTACKAIGGGGLLIDAITMARAHAMTLQLASNDLSPSQLFGIGGARYIIATNQGDNSVEQRANSANIPIAKLGTATPQHDGNDARLIIGGQSIISLLTINKLRQQLKNKIYK
ncbi:MAG: phosphoribosylformylglycinamidine synthase subunit PurL [Hydrotalea sp.]|nr:phosphoribosylformylglycinamidine synthase subunit PurL [Hydrotalea sp.]